MTAASDARHPRPVAPADLWPTIDALWSWLEAEQPVTGREGLLLRILKLSEEVGETAQAVIGATGQNPRKGTTHTWDDVRSELCDVAITALVALRTLTPEAERVFGGIWGGWWSDRWTGSTARTLPGRVWQFWNWAWRSGRAERLRA